MISTTEISESEQRIQLDTSVSILILPFLGIMSDPIAQQSRPKTRLIICIVSMPCQSHTWPESLITKIYLLRTRITPILWLSHPSAYLIRYSRPYHSSTRRSEQAAL